MSLWKLCYGTALAPHRAVRYDEVEGPCPTCMAVAFAGRIKRVAETDIVNAPKPTLRDWLKSVWRSLWG